MEADTHKVERDLNGNFRAKSAATWVTEDEQPDPEGIRVLNEWILVRPISLTNKIRSKSGFELLTPENTMERQNSALTVGRVIGIGEFAGKRQNVSKPEIGDHVIFPMYGGGRVTLKGIKCVFLNDDSILAVVKPEDMQVNVTI